MKKIQSDKNKKIKRGKGLSDDFSVVSTRFSVSTDTNVKKEKYHTVITFLDVMFMSF